MNYSKSGLALTERFEGCKLEAYRDGGGNPTIGYGHTLGVEMGLTCIPEQAEAWLTEDMGLAERVVNLNVHVALSQEEFDALVDFCYNVGAGNFCGSNLLRVLNAGNYKAAAQQFERWDKAAGSVVAGLLRRRLAEEKEFQSKT